MNSELERRIATLASEIEKSKDAFDKKVEEKEKRLLDLIEKVEVIFGKALEFEEEKTEILDGIGKFVETTKITLEKQISKAKDLLEFTDNICQKANLANSQFEALQNKIKAVEDEGKRIDKDGIRIKERLGNIKEDMKKAEDKISSLKDDISGLYEIQLDAGEKCDEYCDKIDKMKGEISLLSDELNKLKKKP